MAGSALPHPEDRPVRRPPFVHFVVALS